MCTLNCTPRSLDLVRVADVMDPSNMGSTAYPSLFPEALEQFINVIRQDGARCALTRKASMCHQRQLHPARQGLAEYH